MKSESKELQQTKLIILGAGCSVDWYPLAKEMPIHLKCFGESLGANASRLRKLVERTNCLFARLQARGATAQTLDDLARLIHNGALADNAVHRNRLRNDLLVEDAKTAVTAMFLSKEAGVLKKGLPNYRNLMNRIFSSHFGTDYRRSLQNTPYRVLTFNYDRLFELAFRQFFSWNQEESFYGPTVLNSGLFQMLPQKVEIDLSRFSFLKLHGSVGMHAYDAAGGIEHIHQVPNLVDPTTICDDEFYLPSGNGLYSGKPKPSLIVFPHEKDFLQDYPDNRFNYRVYISEVWRAARHFAAQASEIFVIGYSCPEPDYPAWSSLFSAAKNCKQIVIQNPYSTSICERLKHRQPELANLFKPFDSGFE